MKVNHEKCATISRKLNRSVTKLCERRQDVEITCYAPKDANLINKLAIVELGLHKDYEAFRF